MKNKPAVHKFIDWKVKAAMLAGTYYFSHKLGDYDVQSWYDNSQKWMLKAAEVACEKNWPKSPLQHALVMQFTQTLAGLCALDNAYASFFHDFIVEYNKQRGEHRGIPMPQMPKAVQERGVSGETLAEQARANTLGHKPDFIVE
jgi:hypothetical protein